MRPIYSSFIILDIGVATMQLHRHPGMNMSDLQREFRHTYGCTPLVAACLWALIEINEEGAELKYFFWTLYFYNVNQPMDTMSIDDIQQTFGTNDINTVVKWISLFTMALRQAHSDLTDTNSAIV